MIKPINVATVTSAVLSMLQSDTRLLGVKIERATEINATPQVNGWVGVYRARVEYPSRTLGRGAGYRMQRIHLVVLAQHSHALNGAECEDRLEGLLQLVMSVILSDPSLKGSVEMLDEVSVDYQSYERVGTAYMQTAAIRFIGLIPVGVY